MKSPKVISVCFFIILILLAILFHSHTPSTSAQGPEIVVAVAGEPVTPKEFRGDVRNLPAAIAATQLERRPLRTQTETTAPFAPGFADPVRQSLLAPLVMPAPIQNFSGLSREGSCTGGTCGAGWPPDTNGDVGLNHFMQAVNTSIGIFDKTGTQLAAFTFDSFWSGANTGTACDTSNQGDPTVLYDPLADRFIFMDFAWTDIKNGPYYFCFAVSNTGDPVNGGYARYAIRADDANHKWLPDYPKMGLWPDGIYVTANMYDCINPLCSPASYKEVRVFALNRTKMEAGLPLTINDIQIADLNTTAYFSLLPSSMRGASPPAGRENILATQQDPSACGTSSCTIFIFKFHVDYVNPNNSSFTGPTNVTVAKYSAAPSTAPEPSPGNGLDTLNDRLMMQNQYRNIGGTESIWLSHTVDGGGGIAGIRWYQLNVTGGTIATSPTQQGTFAPADSNHRFLPSLAVDGSGNMAVGYSVSSSAITPTISYAGRLTADPPGTLGQGETTLVAGTGVQSGNCGGSLCTRWGDYSAMTIDPLDDCTFWYTNEYCDDGTKLADADRIFQVRLVYACAYAYSNFDSNEHSDQYADQHADAHTDEHSDSNADEYSNCNTNLDSNEYTDQHTDEYSNCITNLDPNEHSDQYADQHTNANQYADEHNHADSYADQHTDEYSNCNTNFDSNEHSDRNADEYTHSNEYAHADEYTYQHTDEYAHTN